jgi:fluoride exporter
MSDPAKPQRSFVARVRFRRWGAPLAVLAGGLLGSAARYVVVSVISATDTGFPTATLTVNVAGSLLLGLFLARRQRAVVAGWSLRFWAIGVLGSFTTFSAFSYEVVRLIDVGNGGAAVGYVAASMLGGVAATLLGGRIGAVGR